MYVHAPNWLHIEESQSQNGFSKFIECNEKNSFYSVWFAEMFGRWKIEIKYLNFLCVTHNQPFSLNSRMLLLSSFMSTSQFCILFERVVVAVGLVLYNIMILLCFLLALYICFCFAANSNITHNSHKTVFRLVATTQNITHDAYSVYHVYYIYIQ